MRFSNWIDGGPISTAFDVATYKLYKILLIQDSPFTHAVFHLIVFVKCNCFT